jgi:membrane protein
VTSEDVDKTKPAPDIFAAALKKLDGIAASDVIVVGDTPYDIEAAKRRAWARSDCGRASFPTPC